MKLDHHVKSVGFWRSHLEIACLDHHLLLPLYTAKVVLMMMMSFICSCKNKK